MKRGPSTVAARSRTSPLGESNTRPGPLVRDHPGWHNPRLDCHTPRPDDCAPKSRSPEFARLYRAGRILRCSFQRGYGDASEARTRTLQRERLMTLPIRLWHRRKEIWLGKRLLLPCRHGMDTAPVGSHHYILLSLSLVAVPAGLEPATP